MLPYIVIDVLEVEVCQWLPPSLEAQLSRRHRDLADQRKYNSIQYPITVEELDKLNVREFYTVSGSTENHVFTTWMTRPGEDNELNLRVINSLRVRDRIITDSHSEYLSLRIEGIRDYIGDAVKLCKSFNLMAYHSGTINDRNFVYELLSPRDEVLVETSVFFLLGRVYQIYSLRCRDVHLDEEVYAEKLTLDYFNEMKRTVPEYETNFEASISRSRDYMWVVSLRSNRVLSLEMLLDISLKKVITTINNAQFNPVVFHRSGA